MRVGIIGIGSIAQVHISSLAEAGQNIVALCDIEIEKCCRANEQFNLNAQVYSSYIEMFDVVRKIAKDYSFPVVDMQEIFSSLAKENGPEYYLYDGVHPTIAASKIIADEWMRVFEIYKG